MRSFAHRLEFAITPTPPLLNYSNQCLWCCDHQHLDSVIGRKDKEDDVLLTLIGRTTRREFIFKMDGKDADSVNYVIETILKIFGELAPKLFKSITADYGSEFSELGEKCQELMGIYFTHPYPSWERGTNENHNRMIRRCCRGMT